MDNNSRHQFAISRPDMALSQECQDLVPADLNHATQLCEQALPELERIGDRRCTASTLKNIAALAFRGGPSSTGRRPVHPEHFHPPRPRRRRRPRRMPGRPGGDLRGSREDRGSRHLVRWSPLHPGNLRCGRLPPRAQRGRRPARCPTSGPQRRDLQELWETGIKLSTDEAVDRCLRLRTGTRTAVAPRLVP